MSAEVIHERIRDRNRPVIPSIIGSGKTKDNISGASAWAKRFALLWRETAVGGRTDVEAEVSHVVEGIVRGEEFRSALAAAGSGEVEKSRALSVGI
jgi:hypothetical protein